MLCRFIPLPDLIKKLITAAFLMVASLPAVPQTDTDSTQASPFTFGAFADVYYLYDFSEPADRERPGFVYSHGRHNEIALNNAVLSATYTAEIGRASCRERV